MWRDHKFNNVLILHSRKLLIFVNSHIHYYIKLLQKMELLKGITILEQLKYSRDETSFKGQTYKKGHVVNIIMMYTCTRYQNYNYYRWIFIGMKDEV